MKTVLFAFAVLVSLRSVAQTSDEKDIATLSNKIFKWETENKIDSLQNVCDEHFLVVKGAGESRIKEQYITLLKSENLKHDSINVEESKATVINNTATVIGKGTFTVTSSGNKITGSFLYRSFYKTCLGNKLESDCNACNRLVALR